MSRTPSPPGAAFRRSGPRARARRCWTDRPASAQPAAAGPPVRSACAEPTSQASFAHTRRGAGWRVCRTDVSGVVCAHAARGGMACVRNRRLRRRLRTRGRGGVALVPNRRLGRRLRTRQRRRAAPTAALRYDDYRVATLPGRAQRTSCAWRCCRPRPARGVWQSCGRGTPALGRRVRFAVASGRRCGCVSRGSTVSEGPETSSSRAKLTTASTARRATARRERVADRVSGVGENMCS